MSRHTGRCTSYFVIVTFLTLYPIFWVFTIAFSGTQSLAIADIPANPPSWTACALITPWPAEFSMSNFVSVMKDQPFAIWLVNSAIVATQRLSWVFFLLALQLMLFPVSVSREGR